MSPRFISNVALGLAGAVVVAASQAFSPSITGWLMFGVSLGVLALLALVQLDRARGSVQRLLDAATGVLAVWSAVASVVYTGTMLTWLSFGEASGFVGLALVGFDRTRREDRARRARVRGDSRRRPSGRASSRRLTRRPG
jgi:hypothetical protein